MGERTREESEELERLRAENAELRARSEKLARGRTEAGERAPGKWRWPAAVTLLVIGGLLLAATVPGVWAADTLLNTDRYTETVAPLAANPDIRDSVANTAVDRLFSATNVEAQIRSALPPKAAFIAPQLASGLRTFALEAAERALATPQFQTLWTEANRQAHQRIVPALLNGTAGRTGAVNIQQGTVSIDISKIVGEVKSALVARGLTFVSSVPDNIAGGTYVLFQSAELAQIQTALRVLQSLSVALPVATLLAFAGSIAAAPDRRKAVLWLGVTAILAMLVLAGALAIARSSYLGSIAPGSVLSPAAAAAFFDILVRFLRNAIRTVAALGLVVLLGAALAGPSAAAVRIRGAVGGGMSSLGLDFGRPAVWVDRHRRALDAAIVVIAAAVLLLVSTPTPGLVIGLAVAALVGILLVELVAHAHPPAGPLRGQPGM